MCALHAAAGIGASAAQLVAAITAVEPELSPDQVFAKAYAAHALVQGGGSGVDLATAVYGGNIVYTMHEPVVRAPWPEGLYWALYDSGESARTAELLPKVLAARGKPDGAAAWDSAKTSAVAAAAAMLSGKAGAFVIAAQSFALALTRLSLASNVAIMTPAFLAMNAYAGPTGCFFGAGAGGGDIAVYLGTTQPTPEFAEFALKFGLRALHLGRTELGAHLVPDANVSVSAKYRK
jgi:phosphomevalonate kinase